MDTYEFIEMWNARLPFDWPAQATIDRTQPGEFQDVAGLSIVYMPGMRIRGVPEEHITRMVQQGLVRKIEGGA